MAVNMPVIPLISPPEPLQPCRSTTLNSPLTPAEHANSSLVAKTAAENSTTIKAVPNVQLDMAHISATMAARLASSLLGHVLFLKSQIPFPIVQLLRMSNMKSDSKAAKKRTELVAAVDTLASHLETTFVALSSAFALRNMLKVHRSSCSGSETAHMIFVVGPSVGAARAKVVLVLEGLEVKPLSIREEIEGNPVGIKPRTDVNDHVTAHESSEDGGKSRNESLFSNTDASEEETATRDSADESDVDSATEPPASQSPSPSSSRAASPGPSIPATPLSASRIPRHSLPLPLGSGTQKSSPRSMPLPAQTYAEEQSSLRAADRLLSRILASACAEDDGGLSSELATTQTHVLLRAPRRFSHPAWIPRQNVTKSLETTLQAFTVDATSDHSIVDLVKPKKKPVLGVKTEGVWISCQGGPSYTSETPIELKEEDEMIWWQWDGRIIGFSDW